MTFLLDTNVLSELNATPADPAVMAWFASIEQRRLYTATIVLAELLYGAEKMSGTRKGARVSRFIESMLTGVVAGRVLPLDEAAARALGRLWAETERQGRPRPRADLQIAAVAMSRNLTLVTRNTRDFSELGVPLLNPWEA